MQLSFLESEKEPFLETTGIGSQARTAHSGSQTGVLSHHSQVCCHHSMSGAAENRASGSEALSGIWAWSRRLRSGERGLKK